MVKFKEFHDINELNDFAITVDVIGVKYQYYNNTDKYLLIYREFLKKIPTYKLVEELKKREGVTTHEIAPYISEYSISVKSTETGVIDLLSKDDGGAIILEVID